MIEYHSTRGEADLMPFSGVIMEGLASDGGLYVPVDYPQVSKYRLHSLAGLPYEDVFRYVSGKLIGDDVSLQNQQEIADETYGADSFDVSSPGVVTPVDEVADGIYIQELSLGPTAAFKDMALQPLGKYFGHVLGQRGGRLAMLGATSGDTGSAAEAAIQGVDNVSLAMMSPQVGMSEFQRAQMGELTSGNILNLSVDGRFDDCQDLVKAIKKDPEFTQLGAVNSINWGRVAFQVPYYFAGYLQIVGDNIGQEVDFTVPSGNFGNVLAGYIAKRMGLPIRRLIVATNENDVLDALVQRGDYQYTPSQITSSPSMDISEASNYERLVLDIMDGDQARTALYMKQFATQKRVAFSDFGLPDDTMQRLGFDSGASTASDRVDSIKWIHESSGRIIDPHTADGLTVARRKAEKGVPMICLSTALPVKFEATIREALGFVPARPQRFVGLEERVAHKQDAFIPVPNDIDAVKAILRTHNFTNRA